MTTPFDPGGQRLGTILVTGAGGAAAVTLLRSFAPHARIIACDMDPYAVGLYLAPPEDRVVLPRADDPAFLAELVQAAIDHDTDLVVPTVDVELLVVAKARETFAGHGIRLLVESEQTLKLCLDKAKLVEACAGVVRVPRTVVLTASTTAHDLAPLGSPFCVKPRAGAGGRGFAVINSAEDLLRIPADASMIAQEYLPGQEYSIDVLARPDGHIVAAVPRARDKVDSGIAVAGRTVRSDALETFGRDVARTIAATTVVNVQARLAADGAPALLEVNPRFPGTMALTQAAGIDMPLLAAEAAYGRPIPEAVDFVEIAMVRHWHDLAVPVEEYPDPVTRTPLSAGVVGIQ